MKPNLEDPWVRAELDRTEMGRRALWHYHQSKALGISKSVRRAELRIAERQAQRALERESDG